MNNTKSIFSSALIAVAVAAMALSAPVMAKGKKAAEAPIPVVGKTLDGKYSRLDLSGDLDDFNYVTSKSILYQPGDLLTRVVFLDPADVKSGAYACDYVCKDKAGFIVGLHPGLKAHVKAK